MKTGNTSTSDGGIGAPYAPQWSPVMKTGNTSCSSSRHSRTWRLNGARS